MRSIRNRVSSLILTVGCLATVLIAQQPRRAADPSDIAVYFSPKGGCTEAVVKELNAARREVKVQAYSFTSTDIAKALVQAQARGVKVTVILDKSNNTDQYSAATFLTNEKVPTFIDSDHPI